MSRDIAEIALELTLQAIESEYIPHAEPEEDPATISAMFAKNVAAFYNELVDTLKTIK